MSNGEKGRSLKVGFQGSSTPGAGKLDHYAEQILREVAGAALSIVITAGPNPISNGFSVSTRTAEHALQVPALLHALAHQLTAAHERARNPKARRGALCGQRGCCGAYDGRRVQQDSDVPPFHEECDCFVEFAARADG